MILLSNPKPWWSPFSRYDALKRVFLTWWLNHYLGRAFKHNSLYFIGDNKTYALINRAWQLRNSIKLFICLSPAAFVYCVAKMTHFLYCYHLIYPSDWFNISVSRLTLQKVNKPCKNNDESTSCLAKVKEKTGQCIRFTFNSQWKNQLMLNYERLTWSKTRITKIMIMICNLRYDWAPLKGLLTFLFRVSTKNITMTL